jgi:hypothetical protein
MTLIGHNKILKWNKSLMADVPDPLCVQVYVQVMKYTHKQQTC